jgi:hypothetical protein
LSRMAQFPVVTAVTDKTRFIRIDGRIVVRQEIHRDFPKYGRYVRVGDKGASELARAALNIHKHGDRDG